MEKQSIEKYCIICIKTIYILKLKSKTQANVVFDSNSAQLDSCPLLSKISQLFQYVWQVKSLKFKMKLVNVG